MSNNKSLKALAVEIAREVAEMPETNVSGEWESDDSYVVSSSSPVSPFELRVKHYLSSGEETGRINVTVASSAISCSRLVRKAGEEGLEVVDIWQGSADLEREMGQHSEPGVNFGLEQAE